MVCVGGRRGGYIYPIPMGKRKDVSLPPFPLRDTQEAADDAKGFPRSSAGLLPDHKDTAAEIIIYRNDFWDDISAVRLNDILSCLEQHRNKRNKVELSVVYSWNSFLSFL